MSVLFLEKEKIKRPEEIANFVADGFSYSIWQFKNGKIMIRKIRSLNNEIEQEDLFPEDQQDQAAAAWEYLRGKVLGNPVNVAFATDDEIINAGLEAVSRQYDLFVGSER